jgi:hypothetical protein
MQIATTFLNKDKSVEQVARFSLFFWPKDYVGFKIED